eukprot:CAMPEP_0197526498 /NCGR_PEP_ID=MMETSP1318-20131121/17934_1 /TAXON_ID=552666 /ORGANISM="Partenskyella glossopodia, Strain RCC365" /LENGTH=44 /DNA_ID= /DNA_START= /DNA_END= /DNA_ORIENTATION=
MEPWTRSNRDEDWKKEVVSQICPDGVDCEFNLKPDWEKFRDTDY